MKVLVTGAAGQVGSRLTHQLVDLGYEVKGVILPNDSARNRIEDLNVEIVKGNLLDPELSFKLVSDVDAIINTANLVNPLPGMSDSEFFDNNVRGTFHLVLAASKRAESLERFVHISSSSVYSHDPDIMAPCYSPVDEMHPLRPMGLYPSTKITNEQVLSAYARETGLKTAVLRPGGICSSDSVLKRWSVRFVCNILKSGQEHPKSSLFMNNGTELWHDLEQAAESMDQLCSIRDSEERPWMYRLVDARDVAHACICALENPAAVGEVFNIASPYPISFFQATHIISKATGQSILEWKVPVRWNYDLDISKAKSLINYKPSWGIKEMIQSALKLKKSQNKETK